MVRSFISPELKDRIDAIRVYYYVADQVYKRKLGNGKKLSAYEARRSGRFSSKELAKVNEIVENEFRRRFPKRYSTLYSWR